MEIRPDGVVDLDKGETLVVFTGRDKAGVDQHRNPTEQEIERFRLRQEEIRRIHEMERLVKDFWNRVEEECSAEGHPQRVLYECEGYVSCQCALCDVTLWNVG